MTFTASNLFPSHSCICVTRVKSQTGLNLGPQHERPMIYQLSFPPTRVCCFNSTFHLIFLTFNKMFFLEVLVMVMVALISPASTSHKCMTGMTDCLLSGVHILRVASNMHQQLAGSQMFL